MDNTADQCPGGSAGKFQRLADEESSGPGPRIRKIPSKDSYEYSAPPYQASGLVPFDGGGPAPQPLTVRRWSSSKRKSSVSDAIGEPMHPVAGLDPRDSNSTRRHSEDTQVRFALALPNQAEGHEVQFRDDSKPDDGVRSSPSCHRRSSAGLGVVSCDGSSQGGGSTRVSFGADSPDSVPSSLRPPQSDPMSCGAEHGVKFSEETKPGPSLGRTPSIQRKGTPGLALMSGLADVASEFSDHSGGQEGMSLSTQYAPSYADPIAGDGARADKRAMFRDNPTGDGSTKARGVQFIEENCSGPSLQRSASAIQRKATPGLALMSDLADMAEHGAEHSVHFSPDTNTGASLQKSNSLLRKGTPGIALMSDLADMAADIKDGGELEMQTPSAVQFTPDTKSGPSFGRTTSIQRKGTPGVSLMSDMADIAAEVQNDGWADDSVPMKSSGSVQFSADTQLSARSLQRSGSSIQRRATPGVALMSDLADLACADQDMASDHDDNHSNRPGVKFSQETKSGPNLGRSGSSIRRTGTPGVALLSDAADIATDIQDRAAEDICGQSPGVSFSEGTKTGPTGSTIQRKWTPGMGLMSGLADITSELSGTAGTAATSCGGVHFAEDVKPGPSLQRINSAIQRKGTPGVALMSNMADIAAEYEEDSNVDMRGFPAVHFSAGTKQEPAFGRVPSIQRKGTPGAGLMSDIADMAADLQSGEECSMGDDHSVRFSDNTNFEPSLQRSTSSIQRKGTPGVALMSDLADMADEMIGEAGDELMADRAGVRFTADTKSEPAFGRTPSVQRRATPGCGLGPDLHDLPEEADETMAAVRFSAGTKSGPSLNRGPSIQRKSTPGCGLMSDLADIASEEQGAAAMNMPIAPQPLASGQNNLPQRLFTKMKSASRVDYTPPDERIRKPRFSLTSDPLVHPPDLGEVGEELSAIFGRPSAAEARSPSIVAPVARRLTTTSATQETDDSLDIMPRMMSDTSNLTTGGRFLNRNPSLTRPRPAPVNPSEDTSMEGLTAAMAELGHPALLQRQT